MDMTGFILKKCDGHHKKAPCPCFMRTDFCLFVPWHGNLAAVRAGAFSVAPNGNEARLDQASFPTLPYATAQGLGSTPIGTRCSSVGHRTYSIIMRCYG